MSNSLINKALDALSICKTNMGLIDYCRNDDYAEIKLSKYEVLEEALEELELILLQIKKGGE